MLYDAISHQKSVSTELMTFSHLHSIVSAALSASPLWDLQLSRCNASGTWSINFKSTPSACRSVNKSYCSCPHWFKPEEKDVRTGRHVKFLLANWSIKRCVTKETLAFLANKKRSTSERINYIPTSKQMSTAGLTRCYLGKGHIEALLDRFHDIEIFEFEGSNSARCLNLLMVVPCATQSHRLTQTPSVGAESQFVRRSASLTSLVLFSTKCI